jgi:tetratricopeptide (TPR) repeat protein
MLGLLLLVGAPLAACVGVDYGSVHFNAEGIEFFHLPQPWIGVPVEHRAGKSGDEAEYYPASDPHLPEPDVLIEEARKQEQSGRFRLAAKTWVRLKRVLQDQGPFEGAAIDRAERGLEDRVAALRLWRGERDTEALRKYLRARDLVSSRKGSEAVQLLSELESGRFRRHAVYLSASAVFYAGDPEKSAATYSALLSRFPDDALAAYMIGRSYFRPVRAAEEEDAKPLPARWRAWLLRAAIEGYRRCERVAPGSSLAADARGMAAACYYRLGQYPAALRIYCRKLADLPAGQSDLSVWLSARRCLRKMTAADHREFQGMVEREPRSAIVYIDLQLHYDTLELESHPDLAQFALRVLDRRGAGAETGKLLAQIATVEERSGHPARALRVARRAVARCPAGMWRDQARWQVGSALRRLNRKREALTEFERLIEETNQPKLQRGAREAAALLGEETGDIARAIYHYLALERQYDLAYAVDCLASQRDLRDFLRRYPRHPRAWLIRYSLGYLQLRDGEYDAAVRTFSRLGKWLEVAEGKYRCTTEKGEERAGPLRAARYLADLTRRAHAASRLQDRARIEYEVARFMFHQRHLLFYNPAIWVGGRVYALDLCWSSGEGTQHEESWAAQRPLLARHQERHTALYQALKRFERVAWTYPRSPEAPKALYSAALCYTILPRIGPFWGQRANGDSAEAPSLRYEKRAIALYRRIRELYPNDPLSREAAEWGGPGSEPRPGRGGKPARAATSARRDPATRGPAAEIPG